MNALRPELPPEREGATHKHNACERFATILQALAPTAEDEDEVARRVRAAWAARVALAQWRRRRAEVGR